MNLVEKNYAKILCGSFLVGLAISLAGCGKAGDSGGPVIPGYGTPAVPGGVVGGGNVGTCSGGFNTTGLGCLYGDFYSACVNAPAQLGAFNLRTSVVRLGSTDVCKSTFALASYSYTSIGASLVPAISSPGASALSDQAHHFNGRLLRGDTVNFGSISGGWQAGSCWSVPMTNDIVISDGTQIYPLMAMNRIVTIANSGYLSIGFSAPAGATGCWKMSWSGATVTRCLDAGGNSYACQ